jgi:hypothetical protein
MDGKAQAIALGLGGAYCTCCKVTEPDGKNPDRIRQGLTIDRNMAELTEIFDRR